MARKLPWFKFHPSLWRTEPNLCRCSKAAKGVWMDMLCLMFECEDRGVLSTGGEPWSDDEIAEAVGGDTAANLACLRELLRKGVASRNPSGAIYNRRMARNEDIGRKRSESGKKGGAKTQAKAKQNGKQKSSNGECNLSILSLLGFSSKEEMRTAFDDWWSIWPSKTQKVAARKAYEKALQRIVDENLAGDEKPPDWLLERTQAFARSDKAKGDFCPYPATWLNQGRYEDDPREWGDDRTPPPAASPPPPKWQQLEDKMIGDAKAAKKAGKSPDWVQQHIIEPMNAKIEELKRG